MILSWTLVLILCTLVDSNIFLYEQHDFKKLIGNFQVNDKCTSLPDNQLYKVKSLVSEDCIVMFENQKCKVELTDNVPKLVRHRSLQIFPGRYSNTSNLGLSNIEDIKTFNIASFSKCSQRNGGPTNVHLYDKNLRLLVKYDNVCDRIEIPDFAVRPFHFFGSNCIHIHVVLHNRTKVNFDLPGGIRRFSYHFAYEWFRKTYSQQLLSIEPCVQNKACLSLNATVTSFRLLNQKNVGLQDTTTELSMGASTTFINDGLATISQEYTASKSVKESTELSLINSISSVDSWNVQVGIETSFSEGVPLVASSSVTVSLSTAYTREKTESIEQGRIEKYERFTEFSVKQTIVVEACTKYKMDSVIRVAKNYPMTYEVIFEVKGTNGNRSLSANEIKTRLGNLQYLENKDSTTVVASDTGTLLLNFGVEAIIKGKGEKIDNCKKYTKSFPNKLQSGNLTTH